MLTDTDYSGRTDINKKCKYEKNGFGDGYAMCVFIYMRVCVCVCVCVCHPTMLQYKALKMKAFPHYYCFTP